MPGSKGHSDGVNGLATGTSEFLEGAFEGAFKSLNNSMDELVISSSMITGSSQEGNVAYYGQKIK